MTEKLYYKDACLREFDAQVLSCTAEKKRFAVRLDRTAFFPEGGGQYADRGTLGAAHVLDVQEADGEITHFTDQPLNVGETVRGVLDFDTRFVRMQNHSGEHIVSGFAARLFGCTNVGFHLGDGDVTVDYDKVLTREDLDRIETLANEAVTANLTIRTEFPAEDQLKTLQYRSKLELTENVRIVTIGDVDCCACCAPHVARTGEIGSIRILDFEHYKGGIRLHMLCGKWALASAREAYTNIRRISNLLCVPQTETADAVEHLARTLKNKDYERNELCKALAESALQTASRNAENICFFAHPACDTDALRHAVNCGMAECMGLCAGFVPTENGFRYCIGSENIDLRKAAKDINAAICGRGGGQPTMIQGTAAADRETILAYCVGYE